MDEKHETLAEIAAEIREWANNNAAMGPSALRDIANRLEAIAKASEFCAAMNELHERVGNATTTGNAAAIREALIIAKKDICHHAKYICQSLSWENSDIQSNCGDILCAQRDLCEAKTAIQKALSAPPRNCDRFKSVKEAAIEFSKRRDNPQPCPDFTFSAWLFATAEEREGEGDGRK